MKEYTKEINISKFITWQSLADYVYIIDDGQCRGQNSFKINKIEDEKTATKITKAS